MNFVLAALIMFGLIVAYCVGYRMGVRYCIRHLGPLEEAARALVRSRMQQ